MSSASAARSVTDRWFAEQERELMSSVHLAIAADPLPQEVLTALMEGGSVRQCGQQDAGGPEVLAPVHSQAGGAG